MTLARLIRLILRLIAALRRLAARDTVYEDLSWGFAFGALCFLVTLGLGL